jgi:hypothetical protein
LDRRALEAENKKFIDAQREHNRQQLEAYRDATEKMIQLRRDGHARTAPRSVDEELVQANQEPSWSEDRSRGSHAAIRDDPVAHGTSPTAVQIRRVMPATEDENGAQEGIDLLITIGA